jgi:desumoylating isopeptidase 1
LSQFANLFENLSSSEWLLYISEWQYCNNTLSNIRVTTKVAVNSLLSDNKDLQDRGSAILHNLACKEVKSVVGIPAAHP